MSKSKDLSKKDDDDKDYHIPWRIRDEYEPIDEWCLCHDFFYGYGYHNDAQHKWVRCRDVKRLLNLELFEIVPTEDKSWKLKLDYETSKKLLEDLYDQLQEPLRLEAEKRAEEFEKRKHTMFTKISIPLVNRPFPKLF